MTRPREWQTIYASGRVAYELWEHPGRSFGWSQAHLESYVRGARWELLFNALVLSAGSGPASDS